MIRRLLQSAALTLCTAPAALACAFHGFGPLPSMVEQLLASEHIVIARASSENVFRFEAVEAISGGLDHVEIPFLVDSVTRRKLEASPEAGVLFARDGAYGPWRKLLFVDADMRPIIDQVAASLPAWQTGGDAERFALFAGKLRHANPAVRGLALRELDQAPYGMLRDSVGDIDAAPILARLDMVAEADLKPIRVLLLGLSEDPRAEPILTDGLNAAVELQGQLLGAYATAYLEFFGPDAVPGYVETYLSDTGLPAQSRELLTEALALNAMSGGDEMHAAVHANVDAILSADPTIAPTVARQFGSRGDWSFEPTLTTLMKSGAIASALDMLVVSQYVSLAQQDETFATSESVATE